MKAEEAADAAAAEQRRIASRGSTRGGGRGRGRGRPKLVKEDDE